VKAAKPQSILERMTRLHDTISRRAFQLFEKDGRIDGQALKHWLEAEREFLLPVHIQMEETDGEFVVHAELPGFTARDIEVSVEPRRVTITGKLESKQEDKKRDATHVEQSPDEVFRTLELPAEVNTTKVAAALNGSVLDIRLPKAAAALKQGVSDVPLPKAAAKKPARRRARKAV
jgi:HSP20 family protein